MSSWKSTTLFWIQHISGNTVPVDAITWNYLWYGFQVYHLACLSLHPLLHFKYHLMFYFFHCEVFAGTHRPFYTIFRRFTIVCILYFPAYNMFAWSLLVWTRFFAIFLVVVCSCFFDAFQSIFLPSLLSILHIADIIRLDSLGFFKNVTIKIFSLSSVFAIFLLNLIWVTFFLIITYWTYYITRNLFTSARITLNIFAWSTMITEVFVSVTR